MPPVSRRGPWRERTRESPHYSSIMRLAVSSFGAGLPSTLDISSRVFCVTFCSFLTNRVGYVVDAVWRNGESFFCFISAARRGVSEYAQGGSGDQERENAQPAMRALACERKQKPCARVIATYSRRLDIAQSRVSSPTPSARLELERERGREKTKHLSSSISLASLARKNGYVPSSHAGTNTTGHSSPFAAWHVEMVTFCSAPCPRVAQSAEPPGEGGKGGAHLELCVALCVLGLGVCREHGRGEEDLERGRGAVVGGLGGESATDGWAERQVGAALVEREEAETTYGASVSPVFGLTSPPSLLVVRLGSVSGSTMMMSSSSLSSPPALRSPPLTNATVLAVAGMVTSSNCESASAGSGAAAVKRSAVVGFSSATTVA